MTAGMQPPGSFGGLEAYVLLTSSSAAMRRALTAHLTDAGLRVAVARTENEMKEQFALHLPDVLLIEKAASPSRLISAARGITTLPIIAIVPADAPDLRLTAFDEGADDCVSIASPPERDDAGLAELSRRLTALLRRMARATGEAPLVGPQGVFLRARAHEVEVNGVPVELTPREFAVLRMLLERRGEVVTPDEISQVQWGHATFGIRNFVEAHVSRVRAKLRAAGAIDVIVTVRGVGYKVP
jgi:DNA-binding response OmpR family regulator